MRVQACVNTKRQVKDLITFGLIKRGPGVWQKQAAKLPHKIFRSKKPKNIYCTSIFNSIQIQPVNDEFFHALHKIIDRSKLIHFI